MFSTKGVSLKTVVGFLESFAPTSLSEKWDNTGLLLQPQNEKPIANVLLTNDLTEDVVQEAVNRSTDLIISYHPPIFRPLKRITASSWKVIYHFNLFEKSQMAIYEIIFSFFQA